MEGIVKYFVAIVIFFASAHQFANGENCDKLGILVYEDMACRPRRGDSSVCPNKYECEGLRKSDTECFYRGRAYKTGEPVQNSARCHFGCFCNIQDNTAEFTCAQFGCGNWGREPPRGCYYTFELDKCCSSGTKCLSQNETAVTCTVDGVAYREGEGFFPKNSCHHCICKKGFRGRFEAPFCKRTSCGVQLSNQDQTQRACAPVYFKAHSNADILCCPSDWLCPDGTEVINSGVNGTSHQGKCQFGGNTLLLGDTFEKNITQFSSVKKVQCKCQIPPLLTCVEVS